MMHNKLGLSWAKLSSSWDWTLLQFSVDLVYLDLDFILKVWLKKRSEQAGAELGQAQLKLGLDLDLFGILGLVAS